MKCLIIEDDENKIKQVTDFIAEYFKMIDLTIKKSYQSGLKEIILNKDQYSLLILDMSMPTYDVSSQESGYKFRPLAGKEILDEMFRKAIFTKTIILTQFEGFGEGKSYISLAELNKELKESFPKVYIGTIYYNAAETNWKNKLKKIFESNLKK